MDGLSLASLVGAFFFLRSYINMCIHLNNRSSIHSNSLPAPVSHSFFPRARCTCVNVKAPELVSHPSPSTPHTHLSHRASQSTGHQNIPKRVTDTQTNKIGGGKTQNITTQIGGETPRDPHNNNNEQNKRTHRERPKINQANRRRGPQPR